MSSKAWWTVTGKLSISAVASIEAGVVSSVITAHRNRQFGPSDKEQSDMQELLAICVFIQTTLRGAAGQVQQS